MLTDPPMMLHTLAFLTRDGWRPGIGDPSVSAWVIVACYFASAALCGWALRVARIGARLSEQYPATDRRRFNRALAYRASFAFWAMLIGAFVFLGLNKQLDLQTWLTEVGRSVALRQGWYEQRRAVQAVLVIGVAIVGLASLAGLLAATRHLLPRHVPAFVGVVLLACFVIARASSFHQLDAALRWDLLGVKLRILMELAGILCVGFCAWMNCRWCGLRPAPAARR